MKTARNHKDIKLLTSREKYRKYVMKPKFKGGYPFEGLYTVDIKMNQPV